MNTIFGTKIDQTQGFLQDGKRVPISRIQIDHNTVTRIKSGDSDGYDAIQVTFGTKKKINKPTQGLLKKTGIKKTPRFFREIRQTADGIEIGQKISAADVLKPGDIVSVTGTSKGKGFAGVVKRHGFAGGPRTHGQSDRERAPGSIGASTTPGRVLKGKKMAGRMGNEQVTIKNLMVIEIVDDTVLLKGLIPGSRGSLIKIVKIGKKQRFTPLYKKDQESEQVSDNKTKEKDLSSESSAENEKEIEENKNQQNIQKSQQENEKENKEISQKQSNPDENKKVASKENDLKDKKEKQKELKSKESKSEVSEEKE